MTATGSVTIGSMTTGSMTTGSMTTGSMTTAALVLFTLWCAVLAAVDLRVRRLPNALTGAGALAVFGYALATGRPWPAVVGALLLASPYLAVHLAAPAACGAGDAKLAVAVGAAAGLGGAQAWVTAALGAPVLTAAAGSMMLARA
ncbi:prepilin peptidase, partial [Nocardia farcinica]|uniref:prepilin peptidase n=1 Tax=Nocardia farcinica TaxID=37329 RepID=UPI002458FC8E